jgi:uncharacterized protein (TIGR02246 family)
VVSSSAAHERRHQHDERGPLKDRVAGQEAVMFRVRLLALALTLGLVGCASQPSPDVVRQEVQDFVRKYADAANKGDVTALMEMVSREQGVTSTSDGVISRGWEAIRAGNDAMVGKDGSYKFSIGSVDVRPLGASNALAVATMTATVAAEGQTAQQEGAMTLVLEKSKDGWKILHEHFSTKASDGE